MPSWLAIATGSLIALALAVFGYASLIERNAFRVRRSSVRVLPPGYRPFKVLHISDLHLRNGQRRKLKWISSLAELTPDLVVNTGDNLGGRGAVEELAAALEPLRGVQGVFVNGSNDYEGPKFRNPLAYFRGPSQPGAGMPLESDSLELMLQGLGWHNLNNRAKQLEIASQAISFVGVDDPHIGRADFQAAAKGLPEQLAFTIGVAHAPYLAVLQSFADLGVSLIFAGHTHGGQVCLPGGRALVTNCDLPPKFARGFSGWSFGESTLVLHVCAGLGTSALAPFRLFSPPEVALIELLPVS